MTEPAPAAPPGPARRGPLVLRLDRRRTFAAVLLVALLAVVEGGLRVARAVKLSRRAVIVDRPRFETTRGAAISDHTGGYVLELDPRVLYRPRPNQRNAVLSINALGFRGAEWATPKPAGRRRVIVLGGSVVFGFGASSDQATIPAQLEAALRARPDAGDVEVLNAGVNGYDAAQELALLGTRLLDHAPDVVVLLDGWNDFHYAGLTPPGAAETVPTVFSDLETVVDERNRPGRSLLRASLLVQKLEAALDRLTAPPPAAGSFGEFSDTPALAARYRAYVERAARLARACGVEVVLATQPEVGLRAPRSADEQAFVEAKAGAGYVDYARARYPDYARAGREAAAAAGAAYVDATRLFEGVEGTFFVDWVHLTDEGSRRAAQALAPAVAAALARLGPPGATPPR